MGIYKITLSESAVYSRQFFVYFFCLAMYKMVDSGCSIDIYKSEKISIRTDHPDHLNTTKMCKRAVKKVPYLLRYVSDQCVIKLF